MDYLAYLIIYLLVSFGVLPIILNGNNYKQALKHSFMCQIAFLLLAIFLFVVLWAFNQVGLL